MADLTPITREEKFLAKAGGQEVELPKPPYTREEKFLKVIAEGGGGGTDDYSDLSNKPKINNVELNGNKSWADLGLSNPMHIAGRVDTYQDLPATASEGDVYLVGLAAATEKDEYVYVSGGWEYLGSNTSGLLPDNYDYTTFGNGKRLYVCASEPTGNIPDGSIWIPASTT